LFELLLLLLLLLTMACPLFLFQTPIGGENDCKVIGTYGTKRPFLLSPFSMSVANCSFFPPSSQRHSTSHLVRMSSWEQRICGLAQSKAAKALNCDLPFSLTKVPVSFFQPLLFSLLIVHFSFFSAALLETALVNFAVHKLVSRGSFALSLVFRSSRLTMCFSLLCRFYSDDDARYGQILFDFRVWLCAKRTTESANLQGAAFPCSILSPLAHHPSLFICQVENHDLSLVGTAELPIAGYLSHSVCFFFFQFCSFFLTNLSRLLLFRRC
jgi:hypothetical protein